MKILVLFTGGTIGSTVDGATVHTDPAAASRLLSLYRARFGEDVLFEVRRPCNLLSENATPGLWSLLERSVREEELAVYDGVIITHGSDTLPYTCAALAFLLRDVPIPLVLVASNYSLGDSRSNGLANFRSAVELIASRQVRGVFTVFQDEKGANRVYLAARIQEADTARDQFTSYGGVDLGKSGAENLCGTNILTILRQVRSIKSLHACCPQIGCFRSRCPRCGPIRGFLTNGFAMILSRALCCTISITLLLPAHRGKLMI